MRRYTRSEVALHNTVDDCWVIAHNVVYCLSDLMSSEPFELCRPILERAGDDVSHWFLRDEEAAPSSGSDASGASPLRATAPLSVKTFVHPVSNILVPYTPEGHFVHVPVVAPLVLSKAEPPLPWWNDPSRMIGLVTLSPRHVRIINTLSSQEDIVETCGEDSVAEIQRKFYDRNAHATSYAWKVMLEGGALKALDPERTLHDNGIPDDKESLETLGLDPHDVDHMTTLLLYFIDDLTVA